LRGIAARALAAAYCMVKIAPQLASACLSGWLAGVRQSLRYVRSAAAAVACLPVCLSEYVS